MTNILVPYLADTILSTPFLCLKRLLTESRRRLSTQPHRVTVYLAIDDPYSYLLLQVLPDFQRRFKIDYDFRTVLNKQPQMYPAPQRWQDNAFRDGTHLAKLYNLEFPDQPPKNSTQRNAQITTQLLHWEQQPNYLENALALFRAYWHDDEAILNALMQASMATDMQAYRHHLAANEQLLADSGHYLGAMLHYGNEWYWGLDRLQYLERRLNQLGVNLVATTEIRYAASHRHFCRPLATQSAPLTLINTERFPIIMYWSIRSPYSYIALERAIKLATHYSLLLIVKPVLPMVMRKMPVPKNKARYILHDANREARQHNIPFGRISDPLGKGVENCYALYEMAQSRGKGIEFLASYARGVWSEGIRSDTSEGLQKLVERVGLDWQEAMQLINSDDWRTWAERNLDELYQHNLWGVPSLKYADVIVFGQDRIDCIEQAIIDNQTSVNKRQTKT